jgi:hypothetical protein
MDPPAGWAFKNNWAHKYNGSCSDIENKMKPLIFLYGNNQKIIVTPKNYLVDKDGLCYIGVAPIVIPLASIVDKKNF